MVNIAFSLVFIVQLRLMVLGILFASAAVVSVFSVGFSRRFTCRYSGVAVAGLVMGIHLAVLLVYDLILMLLGVNNVF